MMQARTFAVALLVGLLSVTEPLSAADNTTSTPPMVAGTLRPAIDFTVAKDGMKPDWNALAGKIVVLDFWATWCTPCIHDFPKMNALQAQFKGKPIVFYSITYEKPGAARELLEKFPLDTMIELDDDFHTFKSFNAWGIPVVYLFDKSGRLITSVHPDHLDAVALDAILAGKEPSLPAARQWSDPAGAETYFRSLRDKQAN